MSNDMTAHLARQAVFSRATFGPGARTYGVLDHITKEQAEVRACYPHPADPLAETTPAHHEDAAKEWTDIAILGLDGLLRAIWAAHPTYTADQVAVVAFGMIREKQGRNEMRTWPDWRTADPNKAIEHDRGVADRHQVAALAGVRGVSP